MEYYTFEAYFTKLVELEADKHPNLTVENLLRANEKLKYIREYMLKNYTDTPVDWIDFNCDNMMSFKVLSDWVDALKKNGIIHSVYCYDDDGTTYLEAYERATVPLETIIRSYSTLNDGLIKEAIVLADKEMPTREIQIEYNNITQELNYLTKRVAEMQDKYVL